MGLLGTEEFYKYVAEIFQYKIVPIAVIGAIFMFVFGGLNIIFSGGDASKIAAGKDIITGTIIGLILILLAQVIIGAIDSNLLDVFASIIKK